MRRADRAARRGTSLQGSDRTAGDSSPVTRINGRLRGRPGPAGGTKTHKAGSKGCGRQIRPARCPHSSRLRPPARTAAPRCATRPPEVETRYAPPCAGAHDDASRRAEGTRLRQAAQSPGAAPPGTGAALTSVPTREGPRGPRPRGPSHARSWTRTRGDVTQDTSESCRPGRNLSQSPRVTSADGGGPVPGGGCRSSLFPGLFTGAVPTSWAVPTASPGTAAAARRRRPPGPPDAVAPPPAVARRPHPAAGAGRSRPCWASTTSPARPGR